MQTTVSIDIPSDIVIALNENSSDLHKRIKFWAAVGLYTLNKLSLAKSARFCDLNVYDFEKLLSENHISISNLTIDDLDKEFEQLNKI